MAAFEAGGARRRASAGIVTTDRSTRASGHRAIPLCAPGAIGFRLEGRAIGSTSARAQSADRPVPDDRSHPRADPRPLRPAPCLPVGGDLELDLAARELRRAGEPIHLRPREFELLAALAANPGRAFTRRQLLDLAWAPETGSDPRTVDVHVHWLRSKIEAMPARPVHLVTIRGFGYRLDPGPR
jgi:hypothetical protein